MTERFTFDTSDGETLEARWDSPDDPGGVVVFCHPHPLQGGSMMAPLMIAVTTRLVEHGFSVLRFNFRGTGESTGTHDHGEAEQLDITSAVEKASGRSLPLTHHPQQLLCASLAECHKRNNTKKAASKNSLWKMAPIWNLQSKIVIFTAMAPWQ